jgi:hypothetical protein
MSTLILLDQVLNVIADLPNVDVSNVPVGSKAYLAVDGPGYWTLTVSSASVDHTTVEAVLNRPGLRWLLDTVVSTVVSSIAVAGNLTKSAATGAVTLTGPDVGTLFTVTGSDVQDMDLTGLAGDTDGDYEVRGHIIADTTGRTYTLRPNGTLPTTLNGSYFYNNAGGPTLTPAANQTDALFGISNSAATCDFVLRMSSKSGAIRMINGQSFTKTTVAANCLPLWFGYIFEDTSTVITKLTIHGSAAGSIKVGSKVAIRKLGFTA